MKFPVPEYGEVPPVAETVTVDVPPLHKIAVALEAELNGVGPEIVIVCGVLSHPLASCAITTYEPVANPVKFGLEEYVAPPSIE